MPRIKLHRMAERTNHGVTVTLLSDGDAATIRVRESNPWGCFDVASTWRDAWTDFVHPYLRAPSYVPLRTPQPASDEGTAYLAAQDAAACTAPDDAEAAAA